MPDYSIGKKKLSTEYCARHRAEYLLPNLCPDCQTELERGAVVAEINARSRGKYAQIVDDAPNELYPLPEPFVTMIDDTAPIDLVPTCKGMDLPWPTGRGLQTMQREAKQSAAGLVWGAVTGLFFLAIGALLYYTRGGR